MHSGEKSRRVEWHLVGILVVLALLFAVTPAQAITYGQADTSHTYVGAIVVGFWPGYGPLEWCSGTLIDPKVFLTAGHCTKGLEAYGLTPAQINISFGPNALTESTWHAVQEWVTSPLYWWGPNSDPHDVAVVILKDPVTDVALGTVAPQGYLDQLYAAGTLAKARFLNVGYGADERLQDTNVREYSWSTFRSLHSAWLYMSQNPHLGDGGTCFGDSGGPTFYVTASGAEYVVAVTSWGDAQCKATNNNYRVDTAESQAFIHDMLTVYET